MSAPTTPAVRRRWTALGRTMRLTASPAQRGRVAAAAKNIRWTYADQLTGLAGPVSQAFAAMLTDGRPPLHRVGAASLPDDLRLVGLQDVHGRRTYLIERAAGAEAVLVLTETPTARARDRVA
jgi:hypothetical protein